MPSNETIIREFIAAWSRLDPAERVDRTKAGEKSVDLPCTGVFELEKGKIRRWRDYFDLGTYLKNLS